MLDRQMGQPCQSVARMYIYAYLITNRPVLQPCLGEDHCVPLAPKTSSMSPQTLKELIFDDK